MPFGRFQRGGVTFDVVTVQGIDRAAAANNSRATVQYEIPWDKFTAAKNALLGYPTPKTSPSGMRYLSRFTPHSIEEDVDTSILHCVGVTRTEGIGANKVVDDDIDEPYDTAHITAVYEALPFWVLEDSDYTDHGQEVDESDFARYVEIGDVTSTQKLAKGIGNSYVYCDAAGNPPGPGEQIRPVLIGAPFPYYETVQTIIWHQIPVVNAPLTLAFSLINSINSVTLWKWAPRQVMLAKVRPIRVRLANGVFAYNLAYDFAINPRGWDHLPDPTRPGQFYRCVSRSDPTRSFFNEADLRVLFRPI